jgi:Putative beta-barrel porin 2
VSAALLLAWALAAPVRLVEVRSEKIEGRPAVVVVATGPLEGVSAKREGREVVLRVAVSAPGLLAAPAVAAPLEAVRIERTPDGVRLAVRVAPEVAYELRRELARVVLLFGSAPPPAPVASAELYRGLFPPSVQGAEGTGSEGEPGAAGTGIPERPAEPKREGFHVGTILFKPSATFSYVDADVSLLDTPQTVRDHYGEARPALDIEIPLRDGLLGLNYEARIRRYSQFAEVNDVTHQGNASLQYPVGAALTLRGSAHFARGLLETTEVDPGGEYFYGLSRYTRRQFGAGLRVSTGNRVDLDVGGALDKVTVDQSSSFFDYERRNVSAGLGIALGPDRRSSLNYSFEQVPASPDRIEAESRIHTLSAAVEGEILPLLSGRASVGYARRDSPHAAAGGQHFRGLTFGAQLKREFGRSSNLVVLANRSTELSAFEDNSFYVTTSVQGVLTAPLPFSFSLVGGGGYHVNRYPTAASELGVPREDRITDWLVGVGRTITHWAFVRVDYRHDRRDSNIDFFDQSTHAFYAQLGLGFVGEPSRR